LISTSLTSETVEDRGLIFLGTAWMGAVEELDTTPGAGTRYGYRNGGPLLGWLAAPI
jgi:hypothetical protein